MDLYKCIPYKATFISTTTCKLRKIWLKKYNKMNSSDQLKYHTKAEGFKYCEKCLMATKIK